MKKVVMFSILLLCSVVLFAGPFGLEMGWTKQDLIENDVEILLEEGNAFLVAPPAPHSSFDTYLVDIDLDFGLYLISSSDGVIGFLVINAAFPERAKLRKNTFTMRSSNE